MVTDADNAQLLCNAAGEYYYKDVDGEPLKRSLHGKGVVALIVDRSAAAEAGQG
jgi:hypothetical protein